MESDKPSQGGQVNIEEAVLQGLGISNGSPSGGDAEEQSLDPATTEEPDRGNTKVVDHLSNPGYYQRCDLPNRETEFRVCVSIHAARNLEGVDCNPLLRVACRCDQKIKKTKSVKGSINPKFNEVKNFTFKCLPLKMMEKILELKVLNVKPLSQDSMVGFFKLDLGLIYAQPNHCYGQKWLVLVDTKHGASNTKGYLKVSMQLIGPGDSVQPLHSLSSKGEQSDGEADDEGLSIICPTGATLTMGKLAVKIHKGEDFPQLDSPSKFQRKGSVSESDLVDPYCVVSYAGHKAKTPVIKNSYDPEWNYEISLPFQLPFMSERIKFQVKDQDKCGKDYVGTFFLNLSQISASGDSGFAPTFGPCFVNMYGSLREYNMLNEEVNQLNKGKYEGVAYRGRVMVEVSSDLDHTLSAAKTEKIQHPIKNDMLQEEYILFGILISATMIQPHDQPIQFEASIGISGYALNDKTSLSSTSPVKPVRNNSGYYSLPFTEQKPCFEVNSVWEDCSHRIEALNTLLHMAEELEDNLNAAKKCIYAEEVRTATDKLDDLLQLLTDNLSQYPKNPSDHPNVNNLDLKMMTFRQGELKLLMDDVTSVRPKLKKLFDNGLREDEMETLNQAVLDIEDCLIKLKRLCYDPQNSIPDVVMWMLCGKKRVAVKRIPSHEIMYSSMGKARGKKCGKIQTVTLNAPVLKNKDLLHRHKNQAQVTLMLWLGSRKDYKEILHLVNNYGGKITTYMEIYEYEKKEFHNKGFKPDTWVDMRGRKIEDFTSKESLNPPTSWRWADISWRPLPPSNQDSGGLEEEERIYEYQFIYGGTEEDPFWGDENGERLCIISESQATEQGTKANVACVEGWMWKTDWQINYGKSKNEEGWTYSVDYASSKWDAKRKRAHKYQRRNWRRIRVRQQEGGKQGLLIKQSSIEMCWEGGCKPDHHSQVRNVLDSYRRRHWIRKLVYSDEGYEAGKSVHKQKYSKSNQLPLQKIVHFSESHLFQFRAYMYQARDLYSGDRSGLSDPYALISFSNYSEATRVIYETRCPVWNQTLMEDDIELCGNKSFIMDHVPPVTLELWDKDRLKSDYLGQLQVAPLLHWNLEDPQLKLQWFKIERYGEYAGELLAGFELFRDDDGNGVPFTPPMKDKYRLILPPISPQLAKFRVQFMCWGVRNLKRLHGLRVNPLVEVECGNYSVKIPPPKVINDKKNANFPNTEKLVTFDVAIPTNPEYAPPLVVKVFAKRGFRSFLVGSNVTKSVKPFIIMYPQLQEAISQTYAVPPGTKRLKLKDKGDSKFDWWCKYYFSTGETDKVQKGYSEAGTRLRLHPKELEMLYQNFTDFLQPFPLFRGKGSHNDPEDHVGCIKGAIKICCLQGEGEAEESDRTAYNLFRNIPCNCSVELIVRVYVVKGIQLVPKDVGGSSDPYLVVSIGDKHKSTKARPITGDLNPLFGEMFELPATLPYGHTLTISVMDWDRFTRNDLIGSTKIDVENRYYSKHRATCGLPEAVLEYGSNKWRDAVDPMEILYDWVSREGLPEPKWSNEGELMDVTIGADTYSLKGFEANKILPKEVTANEQQRLALHILCQKDLVHEHVETRSLYNPMHPGIKQGQLHMWVDIFKKSNCIPPPMDISPRKPVIYELRVVAWNTENVLLDETSAATGEAMSDIYVKGWLQDEKKAQKTDVHYRSLDGTGNFNWRFVFPLEYIPAENAIISRKKDNIYSLKKTEYREDPILTIEVWDNDIFTPDDFIGTIKFDLSKMPYSRRQKMLVSNHLLEEEMKGDEGERTFNLMGMESKSVRGWWKVYYYDKKSSKRIESGDIELEFEVVKKDEAQKKPVGKGRDEPNVDPYLSKPKRPDTSFLWLTSPLKVMRHIVWKYHRWKILGVAMVLVIIIITIVLIFTIPQTLIKSIMTRMLP